MNDDALINKNIKHTCEANKVLHLIPQIKYEFYLSIPNTLARAWPDSKLIQINRNLWCDLSTKQKVNTIVHEVAHLIVDSIYGEVHPHGKEWRACMEAAGEVPYISAKEFLEGGELLELTCGCASVKVTKSRAAQASKKLMYCEACNQPVCLSIGDEKKV